MVLPTDADGTEVNLTGTWMTIEIEIEREMTQQNADNVCEHCAAIVVFTQISVNSCQWTRISVNQFSILNVPIFLTLESPLYLCEY